MGRLPACRPERRLRADGALSGRPDSHRSVQRRQLLVARRLLRRRGRRSRHGAGASVGPMRRVSGLDPRQSVERLDDELNLLRLRHGGRQSRRRLVDQRLPAGQLNHLCRVPREWDSERPHRGPSDREHANLDDLKLRAVQRGDRPLAPPRNRLLRKHLHGRDVRRDGGWGELPRYGVDHYVARQRRAGLRLLLPAGHGPDAGRAELHDLGRDIFGSLSELRRHGADGELSYVGRDQRYRQ